MIFQRLEPLNARSLYWYNNLFEPKFFYLDRNRQTNGMNLTNQKRDLGFIFSVMFYFIFHGQLCYSQDDFRVINLETLQDDYEFNDHLYILQDSLNSLSITDVNNQSTKSAFRPCKQGD